MSHPVLEQIKECPPCCVSGQESRSRDGITKRPMTLTTCQSRPVQSRSAGSVSRPSELKRCLDACWPSQVQRCRPFEHVEAMTKFETVFSRNVVFHPAQFLRKAHNTAVSSIHTCTRQGIDITKPVVQREHCFLHRHLRLILWSIGTQGRQLCEQNVW